MCGRAVFDHTSYVPGRYVKIVIKEYSNRWTYLAEVEVYQKGHFRGDHAEFGFKTYAAGQDINRYAKTYCVWGARVYADGTFTVYAMKSHQPEYWNRYSHLCKPSVVRVTGDLGYMLDYMYHRMIDWGVLDASTHLLDKTNYGIRYSWMPIGANYSVYIPTTSSRDGTYTCTTSKPLYGAQVGRGWLNCNGTRIYTNGNTWYKYDFGNYFALPPISKTCSWYIEGHGDSKLVIFSDSDFTSECNGSYVTVNSISDTGSYGTGFARKDFPKGVSPNEEFDVVINLDPPAAQSVSIIDYIPADFTLVDGTVTVEKYKDFAKSPSSTKTLSVSLTPDGSNMKFQLSNDPILQNLAEDEFLVVRYKLRAPSVSQTTEYTIPKPVITYVSP